ncbi:MAG: (deoxy)nucleoside triphosphate pyrophosphohydrolase [Succinivibrio sp.]|nr:(deoxy)nucleoside triphosphate pyrophosphohydrolase [Succinivibrio sp.]
MKKIKVAAAIIVDGDRILATQRGYGEFKGFWEFPGGKVETYESSESAVVREIQEELSATVEVKQFFKTIEYDYETFHLSMDCFICNLKAGHPVLKEHESAKWLTADTLSSVDWLPADLSIISELKVYL